MQAIGKKIILVALIAAAFLIVWQWKAPEQDDISFAKTNLEAADELLAAWADGKNTLLFRSQDINEKQVYHLLQAQEPYLSTLSAVSYRDGRLELTYEILKPSEQEQGLETARREGAEAAAGKRTITGKLDAIHDTLIRSCVYAENDSNRVQMAAGVSEDGKAVCSGYARAFSAMCDGAGLDVYYMEDDDMTHAWNVIRLYGETYFIDCTYDDPIPDQGERVEDEYFMITTEQFRQSHSWNEKLYEQFLDSRFPENFAYIQRMQDLQLADSSLRAADTDSKATQEELDTLNAVLGTSFTGKNMTRGELYRLGYESLSDKTGSERRIDRLIDTHVVPPLPAWNMGF